MTQAPRRHDCHALAIVPRLNRLAHRLTERVATFGRRLVWGIVGVDHHRNHRQLTGGQNPPGEKTKPNPYPELRTESVTTRHRKFRNPPPQDSLDAQLFTGLR